MTSERSQAYGRVMKALADLSASKLHDAEQETIRNAADGLFFCEDLGANADVRTALEVLELMMQGMVDSDRMLPETAGRIVADVRACGPLQPVAAG
jgi:hypothetical protein